VSQKERREDNASDDARDPSNDCCAAPPLPTLFGRREGPRDHSDRTGADDERRGDHRWRVEHEDKARAEPTRQRGDSNPRMRRTRPRGGDQRCPGKTGVADARPGPGTSPPLHERAEDNDHRHECGGQHPKTHCQLKRVKAKRGESQERDPPLERECSFETQHVIRSGMRPEQHPPSARREVGQDSHVVFADAELVVVWQVERDLTGDEGRANPPLVGAGSPGSSGHGFTFRSRIDRGRRAAEL
jgi:hypothetical protein